MSDRILDSYLGSHRKVSDVLWEPVERAGCAPTVIDAGARNGMFLLPAAYACRCHYIAFEPNVQEHDKLRARNTDAMRAGLRMPAFKSEHFHNVALWEREEKRPFYITNGTGSCTMMGVANQTITRRMFIDCTDDRAGRSFSELYTDVRETSLVQCRPLDDLIETSRRIDLLKLDVEGAELKVLHGSSSLLQKKSILFIKSEVVFFPYYDDHALFGDQHVFLSEHGFRLLGIDLSHERYTRDKTAIPTLADRRLVYAGDAYFALDPDKVDLMPMDLHRLGLISLALGFRSFALSLFRDAQILEPDSIRELEQLFRRVGLAHRMKGYWLNVPNRAASLMRRLASMWTVYIKS